MWAEKYKKWRSGKDWRYEAKHPLFDELTTIIADIMILDGPDGHTDGANLISAYILEHFIVDNKRR